EDFLFSCRTYEEFKDRSEQAFIQRKLEENGWNVSRTAEELGMQRSNLHKKIAKYGLKKRDQ
ncbi:MAG: sigma-54-dependent Fis family transcriptional regulator, partial [Planctomycetes bacterium]|nr:sigma-54-dependent Fis family transcriptional regulator [Planctomycetota bacterium]